MNHKALRGETSETRKTTNGIIPATLYGVVVEGDTGFKSLPVHSFTVTTPTQRNGKKMSEAFKDYGDRFLIYTFNGRRYETMVSNFTPDESLPELARTFGEWTNLVEGVKIAGPFTHTVSLVKSYPYTGEHFPESFFDLPDYPVIAEDEYR